MLGTAQERFRCARVPRRTTAECVKMPLPWPTTDNEAVLYEALDIAMEYLERTGQAADRDAVEAMAASAVLRSYARGVRHRIRLANDAIRALESAPVPAELGFAPVK